METAAIENPNRFAQWTTGMLPEESADFHHRMWPTVAEAPAR
jgi:hypothetical protein